MAQICISGSTNSKYWKCFSYQTYNIILTLANGGHTILRPNLTTTYICKN